MRDHAILDLIVVGAAALQLGCDADIDQTLRRREVRQDVIRGVRLVRVQGEMRIVPGRLDDLRKHVQTILSEPPYRPQIYALPFVQ